MLAHPLGVRSLMFLAAVAVAGTWMVSRQVTGGEASASAVVTETAATVRTQEVISVSIDTPRARREDRRLPLFELRSLLTTKVGELLDADNLEADRRALEHALVARGYLAARVAPASITFGKRGGAYVVFDIDRGPMFHLRSISISGPGEELGVVTLSSGDEAVPARLERARLMLEQALARRATKSSVELRTHEDHAAAAVDVELATTEVTVLR